MQFEIMLTVLVGELGEVKCASIAVVAVSYGEQAWFDAAHNGAHKPCLPDSLVMLVGPCHDVRG